MADSTIQRHDFYVYMLLRLDGTPFYVGRGEGNRWLMHEYKAKRKQSYKDNIICQIRDAGHVVPKVKVKDGLTDAEANALEIKLIREIGRHPNGPLTNMTSGGEGIVDMPPESLAKKSAKLKGRKHSEKTIERIRAASSNPSPETRAKMSAAKMGKKPSAETRQKMSALRKGRPFSDDHKAHIKAAVLKRPAEHYKKIGDARRGKPLPQETREKIRATLTGNKMSDAARAKMSESGKRRWIEKPRPPITEETRQKMRDRPRTEEFKAKIRAARARQAPISAEGRAKISAALRARPPQSEETRQKRRINVLAAIERKRKQQTES